MDEKEKDKKDSSPYPKPQLEVVKPAKEKPLVATRTCNVEFETAIVELAEGHEVHGLTRQEREYLRFWGFVE